MKIFVEKYEDYGINMSSATSENSSGDVYTQCPMCQSSRKKQNQHTKPLGIKVKEGYGRCNHCGWSFHLLTEDYANKIPALPNKAESNIPDPIVSYFESRGISEEVIKRARVAVEEVSIRDKSDGKFYLRKCIAFRYYKNRNLIAIKYRDKQKNFKINRNKEVDLSFYGIDDVKESKTAIIVEGEFDKLAFAEIGRWDCISVPTGTTISPREIEHYERTGELIAENQLNLKFLDVDFDNLQHIDEFIIAVDYDMPGLKLQEELARRLGKDKCKYIKWGRYNNDKGEKIKDANDLLRCNNGKERLKQAISEATPFPVEGVFNIVDSWDKMVHNHINGKEKGKSTGWNLLDPHFKLRFGEIAALNGFPGNGKTSFIICLMLQTAYLYGWKWGIYSPENYPIEDLFETFSEIYIGKPTDIDKKGRMTLKEMEYAKEFIKDHIFVVDNEDGFTPEQLRLKTKQMIKQFGIVGFVTDPWNNLIHKKLPGEGPADYLERELGHEVRFTTRNNIIKIINVHPPNPVKNKEGVYDAPTAFDIANGIMWYNKMYNILCIQREHSMDLTNTNTELHVQKIKNQKLVGIPTKKDNPIILKFERKSSRFLEPKLDKQGFEISGEVTSPLLEVKHQLYGEQKNLMEDF